jgi:hypothetical protein
VLDHVRQDRLECLGLSVGDCLDHEFIVVGVEEERSTSAVSFQGLELGFEVRHHGLLDVIGLNARDLHQLNEFVLHLKPDFSLKVKPIDLMEALAEAIDCQTSCSLVSFFTHRAPFASTFVHLVADSFLYSLDILTVKAIVVQEGQSTLICVLLLVFATQGPARQHLLDLLFDVLV